MEHPAKAGQGQPDRPPPNIGHQMFFAFHARARLRDAADPLETEAERDLKFDLGGVIQVLARTERPSMTGLSTPSARAPAWRPFASSNRVSAIRTSGAPAAASLMTPTAVRGSPSASGGRAFGIAPAKNAQKAKKTRLIKPLLLLNANFAVSEATSP
jgi:hypothetical protein